VGFRLDEGEGAMSMRLVRAIVVNVAVMTVVLLVPVGSAVALDGAAHRQADVEGTQITPSGPLAPAGRDMLVKVRLAGLWEGPSGRMGIDKSTNPKVKDAGTHLVDGHAELDRTVLELAARFNVRLPTEPNADQKSWMAELRAAPAGSAEFDQVFANRLRAAHGGVFKFLAQIRSSTRNTEIRAFAERCMEVVLDHIQVIEATGLVDFTDTEAIPLPALAAAAAVRNVPAQVQPQANPVAQQQTATGPNSGDTINVILGVAFAALVLFVLGRVRPGRGRSR
jgi:putative membrane protein